MARTRSLLLSLLALLPLAARGSVEEIADDVSFEESVMKAEGCWAVLFTATTRPEESKKALLQWELIAAANTQITFGTADVDAVRAVVSEFNIRKRMIPRILVFGSRARQADIIKLASEPMETDALTGAVLNLLSENPSSDEGGCQKTTLAIGSGGSDEL